MNREDTYNSLSQTAVLTKGANAIAFHPTAVDFISDCTGLLQQAIAMLAAGGVGLLADESNYITQKLVDGNGSADCSIDGTTPVTFSYKPPAGKRLIGGRLMLYMAGSSSFSDSMFGNIGALTNGVSVRVNNVEIVNWKTNTDIVLTMPSLSPIEALTSDKKQMLGKWTFWKAAGNVRGLNILEEHGFSVVIQDPLQSLSQMKFDIQGVLEDL